MKKPNTRERRTYIIVALLIIVAMTCRMMGNMDHAPLFLKHIRSVIYLVLFSAWAVSLKRRIIQKQTRQLMMSIAILMVIWLLTRTIKYSIRCLPVEHYLWYFFYLAMLFIPLLSAYVAFSLGKPENFRLASKPVLLSSFITAALFLLVMSNDLHQLVFTFSPNRPNWVDDHYGYGIGYYIVVAWILICALTAFGVMLGKCRIPQSRTMLLMPLIPMACALVYGVLYIIRVPALYFWAGDMTVVFCLLFAAVLESCIQCGLIQTNTHYDELFWASGITAQITDNDFATHYASESAKPIDKAILQDAVENAVMLDGGTRLREAQINGGHIFWQDDVSALLETLDELAGTRTELQGYASLLEEENKQKKRRSKLEEQQRLYNEVQTKTAPHLAFLLALAQDLRQTTDTAKAKRTLEKISVVGAYLKRRSNLILISHDTGKIPSDELALCLKEAANNLQIIGVACAVQVRYEGDMSKAAGTLFDFYETAVELSFNTLTSLNVIVAGNDGNCRIALMLQCKTDLSQLADLFAGASVQQEDGIWYCELTVPGGGAEA